MSGTAPPPPGHSAPELDVVRRWHQQLADRVGMSEPEIADRQAGLDEFCTGHDVTPDQLCATWEDYPELTVRRRPGASETPNIAVESFLIHSGINVFGDIVCVAGRPEDLAAQGRQFVAPRDGTADR